MGAGIAFIAFRSWDSNDASLRKPQLSQTEDWEEKLALKGDCLAYDGLNLSLMSGEQA